MTGVGFLWVGGTTAGESAADAYAEQRYAAARHRASEQPEAIESGLIKALSNVFDRRNPSVAQGLEELTRLSYAEDTPKDVRLQARLSLARAAETLRKRPGAPDIARRTDSAALYDSILREYPGSPESVFAVTYLVQGMLERNGANDREAARRLLEGFLAAHSLENKLSASLHLLAADVAITVDADYAEAVRHLRAALADGIVNPANRIHAHYRLGRMLATHLNDRDAAIICFRDFLERYPDSPQAGMARRYLENPGVYSDAPQEGSPSP